MRTSTVILLLFLSATLAYGQSKKKLRTYGITQKTESIIKYEGGVAVEEYISELERFDENGEWIERVDYQKDGDIKRRELRKYVKGIVVEEIDDEPLEKEWTEKTPDYKHEVFVYDKEELLEVHELNRKGEIKEKKVYEYNKYGDLITETTTGKEGELLEVETYSYDDKGLKTEKKTLNGKGELIEIKSYSYE